MKILGFCPVIIEKGKLLVVLDEEESVYRLPSGKREGNEKGEDVCVRGCSEETGLDIEIVDELPMIRLNRDPETEKPADIELHYYRANIAKKQKRFKSYNFEGHEVRWILISDILEAKYYNVSPYILLLIERGDVK